MSDFGPTRGELIFRLCFSILGLVLMGFALLFRSVAGIAAVEVIGIAGAFFGGTTLWSAWKLMKHRDD